ncbi:hypothetical protein BaRGS_00036762 [Batillaria attramentaria]|uniref:Uncharacterized protein n=1 Tax=Batillaria attramentaria TaxID=370345 RepID=A0ABD0JBZ0_9CAEN
MQIGSVIWTWAARGWGQAFAKQGAGTGGANHVFCVLMDSLSLTADMLHACGYSDLARLAGCFGRTFSSFRKDEGRKDISCEILQAWCRVVATA